MKPKQITSVAMIEMLKVMARRVPAEPGDSFGNYDDTFYDGWYAGETNLAAAILTHMGEDW